MSPTRWPPITFLGLAVTLLGIAKTIKQEAPSEAITTRCCTFRTTRIINTTQAP